MRNQILNIILVALSVVGFLLAMTDKIGALPFLNQYSHLFPIFIGGAVALRAVLRVLGDFFDDWTINDSFKSATMFMLVFCSTFFLLASCSTTGTGTGSTVTSAVLNEIRRDVTAVALATLRDAATKSMNGEKVDLGQAATAGLYAQGFAILTSDKLERLINAWSGDKIEPVAVIAAQKFDEAAPRTAGERQAVVTAIAEGIATATN